jgi:anaerobic magnesium-protoporphyrin IX monomethyl ester cyclase
MNILLINAAFNIYGGVKGHGGTMMPLNLCYLAAYARVQHPDVRFRILDAEILGLSHEQTVEEAASYHPDLIGVTANTCVFDSVIRLVGLLKNRLPDVPVMIGGPHPSAMPEQSLRDSLADFAAIGEGEITFTEVITQLREKDEDWSKINGLGFRNTSGEIHINELRVLVKDLDAVPFPARDLVDSKLYSPPPTKRVSLGPNTLIATSRGCPYQCGFCAAQTVWTRKIRTRKPVRVVAELKECVEKFGIRSFNFTDEFFTADKNRVLEICRLICEQKLNVAWICSARAQHLDRETLEAMREAGCREISYGIESGNQDILKRIDKSLDLDEAIRVVELTKKVGIMTHASYILGYIGETEDTIKDTIRFAMKLNTEIAAFFIASPLPGTPLYREAREKGYLRQDAAWRDYSPLSNRQSVLTFPWLSHTTIRKWHRKALRSYYLRPRYILSRLLSIRHWHDVVNLFGGLKIFYRVKD